MSESSYTDPAAPPRGGVGISQPAAVAAPVDNAAAATVPRKIASRWWLIALCVAMGVVGSFVYLAAAEKVYTSRCMLTAEMEGGTPAGDVAPDQFLYQQRDLIQSPPVIASAATALIKSEAEVRDALDVTIAKGEGIMTIAYRAERPGEAARGANAVADAYLRARSQQQTSAMAGLIDLTRQRDRLAAERTAKESAVRELRDTGSTAGSDAERAAAARLEQLQQAVTAAEVEASSARAATADAKQMLDDPNSIRSIAEANRNKGIFDRLESQRTPLESELAQLEQQQERQRQAMLPEHPLVIATQRRIEQLQMKLEELDKQYAGVYAAHLEQQRATAQKRVDELKQLVAQQSAQAKDYVARAAQLAEAEAELKKVDASIAEVDAKIRDVTLTSGAAAAPRVNVIVPAEPPAHPSHPDRRVTILTAAAIGLLAGVALAAILPRRP